MIDIISGNRRPVLSICIQTYNKAVVVEKLVRQLLRIEREDLDIVVTDNGSTDDTCTCLKSIQDTRFQYIRYENGFPALSCMPRTIYNADGVYALYCNDRDLLYNDSIEKLMDFLSNGEYSFVHVTSKSDNNSFLVSRFNKGYESLNNIRWTYHPTGMVFNVDIYKRYFSPDKYEKYLKDIHTYSFLARDLMPFAGSASADFGCWSELPRMQLSKRLSETVVDNVLFFSPEVKEWNSLDIIDQLKEKHFKLSSLEYDSLVFNALCYFGKSLVTYKENYASKYMTAHYGLKRKFVSFFSICRMYLKFYHNTMDKLKLMKLNVVIKKWRKKKIQILIYLFITCMKLDCRYLVYHLIRKDF